MAKKRNKRKKSSGGAPTKLSPQKYIQTRARKLPFYKCFVNTDWEEMGMASVLVTRQQGGEKLVVGMYMLDVWCLGMKDTHYFFRMDNYEFDNDLLEKVYDSRGLDYEEISEDYAHNLIYGAIEYAEDLGFAPHKDFRLTEFILTPADEIEYMEIDFGHNGQPHYVAGPYDDSVNILNTLSRTVGTGNFNYTLPVGSSITSDFDDEEYEEDDDDFAEDVEFDEVK